MMSAMTEPTPTARASSSSLAVSAERGGGG